MKECIKWKKYLALKPVLQASLVKQKIYHCSESLIMSANTTSTQPLIKLLYHLKLACLLVLVSFLPWKNGIPCTSSAAARMSTTCTTVIAVTLALGTAYATSTGGAGVQCSTVASVEGRLYELRLVGSNATNEGLLQVFMNNRWGWVYSYTDALHVHWRLGEVACHQMGYEEYSNTGISVDESVKQQPMPWLMARVKCSGYESRLVDCGHINFTSTLVPGEQRLHVPLKCIKAPALQNDTLQVQLNGTFSSGILQVKKSPYPGWLPFCGFDLDMIAGHVICRQLGHTHADNIIRMNLMSTLISTPVITSVVCEGFEKFLSECSVMLKPSSSTCNGIHIDFKIYCSDTPLLPLGSEVNVDPENRVQVRYNGFWNYLSSDMLLGSDAAAICQQFGGLGLSKAVTTKDPELRPILPFRFLCSRGNEASLMECIPVIIPPGSSKSNILHVQCAEKTPEYGSLRLVSSSQSSTKGRIEIYGNQSRWGTICDDYWTDKAATVACRQMRLGSTGISHGNAFYGSGEGPILLDDVQCNGDEERLLQCDTSPLGEHNCIHAEDAGVECFDHMPTVAPNKEWKVSLVGGPGPYSGTIQLQIDDRIGTICDDQFSIMDGLVVCKMLGYPFVVSVHVSAKFGMGSGDILLDDLSCTGTESSLESCSFAPVGTHNCMHHEDAGVTCSADSEFGGPARWTEMPLLSVPSGVGLPSNTLNMGIGSATILITLLVVVCVGCMFCACVMRRLRVNSNVETINNIRDNSCVVVNQRESTPASGDIIPPSYTDVLTRPNDYSQVNNAGDTTLPPQSPAPTSPPPSYARTFEVGNNTLRVITIAGPSSAREQRIRREPIPIPLSPPPSYDAVAPIFPSPDNARSGQSLPDVVTVLTDADERIALQDTLTESENTTVV